jgi:hypothetical protein
MSDSKEQKQEVQSGHFDDPIFMKIVNRTCTLEEYDEFMKRCKLLYKDLDYIRSFRPAIAIINKKSKEEEEDQEPTKEEYEKQLKDKDEIIDRFRSNLEDLFSSFASMFSAFSIRYEDYLKEKCRVDGLDFEDERKALEKQGFFASKARFYKEHRTYYTLASMRNRIEHFKTVKRELDATITQMQSETHEMQRKD